MAFFISRKIGMDYTVRGEYVNLILNGNYVGMYWLGEAIKVDKNRVNINEETDYLLEMDISYDETYPELFQRKGFQGCRCARAAAL